MSHVTKLDDVDAPSVVRASLCVWKQMCSLSPLPPSSSRVAQPPPPPPMSHSGYLKLYSLRRPTLDVDYDVILLDEAQDTNPAIQDIIMRQKCCKVIVGDRHQAIYSFIGAEDTLRQVQATRTLTLTRSFRFGHRIATVANVLLASLTDESRTLVGKGKEEGDVDYMFARQDHEQWWWWPEEQRRSHSSQSSDAFQHSSYIQPFAVLARTNSTIFQVACLLMDAHKNIPFLFVGGVNGYGFQDILDTALVLRGNSSNSSSSSGAASIVSSFLKRFKSGASLIKYANATSNQDLLSRIKIIEDLGGPDQVTYLCQKLIRVSAKHETNFGNLTSSHYKMNLVHLGTVHKAKGLEFNNVIMADDFVDLSDPELRDKVRRQVRGSVDEFNIIYVAATRARWRLRVGRSLVRFLLSTGMMTGMRFNILRQESSTESSTQHALLNEQCCACGHKSKRKLETTAGMHTTGCSVLEAQLISMSGKKWKFLCTKCLELQVQFAC